MAGPTSRAHRLGRGQAAGVVFEAVKAEKGFTNRSGVVPGWRGRPAPLGGQ
jgi:hypothetical protein